MDITAPLPAHPAVGEDCLSPELTFQCGGVALNGVAALLHYADGIIVGTGLKYDGVAHNPVDPARVPKFVDAVRDARESGIQAAETGAKR